MTTQVYLVVEQKVKDDPEFSNNIVVKPDGVTTTTLSGTFSRETSHYFSPLAVFPPFFLENYVVVFVLGVFLPRYRPQHLWF